MKPPAYQPSKNFDKSTIVNRICDYLRECIFSNELKPGEQIDINKISRTLSVSTTPIREALKVLTEQGLLVHISYVGYFVVKLSSNDIKELFDLRKSFELLALKYIIGRNNLKAIANLETRIKEVRNDLSPSNLSIRRQIEEDLHIEFLLGGSNTRWLFKLAKGISDLISLSTYLSHSPETACKEHLKILQAIKQNDLKISSKLLEAHLERAKKEALESIRGSEAVKLK